MATDQLSRGCTNALSSLGQRVREARKVRGQSLATLAASAGVGLSTLQCIEAGSPGVALGNLCKVLEALGLLGQLEDLLRPERDPEFVAFARQQLR